MQSKADWLAKRAQHVTATDSPKIVGVSPWGNVADFVIAKLKARAGEFDERESEAMAVGSMIEPALLAWAQDQLGVSIVPNTFCVSAATPLMAATLDGCTEGQEIVECKTAGIVGRVDHDQWGPEGTDEIPEDYLVQVQHAMYVAEASICWVPCLIGGRGRVMYRVPRNDQIIDAIVEAAKEAWEFVLAGQVPDDPPPSFESLKARTRTRGKRIFLDPIHIPLVMVWNEARETRLFHEKREAKALADLLVHMGDAEEADAGAAGLFSFHKSVRRSFAIAELRKQYPEIYQEFARETEYRTARIKQIGEAEDE